MAHDGTNHPWYQGFTNIFGNINQGFQNAMMPQPQTTINPQEFYTDHFKNYYGELAENGMMNVQKVLSTNSKGEQFFDPNKLNDALQNNDFTTISEYLRASQKLQEKELEPKSMVDRLSNNSTFIMGLQLMAAAGEGKSVQEALAPAMSTTQAFMTNQELRKQNKKLVMNKNGTVEERAMDLIGKRAETTSAVAKAGMDQTQAKYFERVTLAEIKNLDLSNDIKEVAANVAVATEGDQMKLVSGKVDLLAEQITAAKLDNQKTSELLSLYPEMLQAELAGALLNNKNTDERTKAIILDHEAQRISNQQAELNLEIGRADYGEEQAFREWVKSQNFSEKKQAILIANGPNGFTALDAKEDINKYRSAYEAYGSSIETSMGKWLTSTGEGLEQEKMQLEETIISTAVKLADGKEPTQENFKEAEALVFSKWGIKKNNFIARFFGDEQYRMTIFSGKAMGGPVQAGRPYTVGEQGPEVFVPNQDGNIVSNPSTPGGYNWEDAIIDNSEMLSKIKKANGRAAAVKALKKFRPDLYV